ncbi:MAG: glycosyltransferase family 9 protein [Altibacter sp.]|nr:glycosyltransferase family 9 protein [Altibacter sp.]
MKILVIQHKMIGDVLTTSLLFELLREKYPAARLDYLINASTQAVVAHHPFIDRFWVFTSEMETSKKSANLFQREIVQEKYDVVIDVYAKLRSALLTKATKASKRISYFKWYTQPMYTQTVNPASSSQKNEGLAIENRVLLVEPLIGPVSEIPKPKIYLQPAELKVATKMLEEKKIGGASPVFMIGILGSGPEKTYPLPYMATLLDAIMEYTSAQLLFNYIPKQQAEADTLISLCAKKTREHIHKDVYGKDLREFLALTAQCDALIGNEGGAVNMAKALGIPTFSIFAPWILKEAWNSYENEGTNASVHLKDFYPSLYQKHPKHYKKQSAGLYRQFAPDFIIPELKNFLNRITT